jgi:hypothetical protein
MQSRLNLHQMTQQVLRQSGESIDLLEGETNIPSSVNSILGSVYQAILEATSYVADYHHWAVLQKNYSMEINQETSVYDLPSDFYSLVPNSIKPITHHIFCDFMILKGIGTPQIKFDFSKSKISGFSKLDFSFRYISKNVIYGANNIDVRADGVYLQNDDCLIIDSRPVVNYATSLMVARHYKDKSTLGEDMLREFQMAINRAINAEGTFVII